MKSIREPAVSGTFYPAEKRTLETMVAKFISTAKCESFSLRVRALISPHAGYVYSGPIAGIAFACLKNTADSIKNVVLLGPAHRVAFSGLALPSVSYFKTPLGLVPLDGNASQRLADLPFVCIMDDAHRDEHSLEVQLPFLQQVLKDFTMVPLVVGAASPEHVCSALEALAPGEDSVIIVSSDLSHYLPYARAVKMDQNTARSIEELDWSRLRPEQACGCHPIRGLLLYAKNHGLRAQTLHLANSGDTAGSRDRVVGYGAFIFH